MRIRIFRSSLFFLVSVFFTAASFAQTALPPGFTIQTYVSGMHRPVDLEWAANGTLFVGTKNGIIWVVKNGQRLPVPFLDIQDEVNIVADRGMLGIAVHPDFPNQPYIYATYTYDPPETAQNFGNAGPDSGGQRVARVIRVTADATNNYDTAVPGSEFVLVGTASTWANIGDPSAGSEDLTPPWTCGEEGNYVQDCMAAGGWSHSIGTVKFGPDGMLYVGNGDAASYTTVDERAVRSLHVDSLSGKILRIDPATGEGLPDNPYWDGDPDSNRSKVWNLGLRNPYRFVFEPITGALYIGDVGWDDWEEINKGDPGKDFGWPCYEGRDTGLQQQPGYAALVSCQNYYSSNNAEPPFFGLEHEVPYGGAIVVGDFYTGFEWPALYHDAMIFTDYAKQEVYYGKLAGNSLTKYPFATDLLAVDFAFGPDGQLYIPSILTGEVERIYYEGSSAGTLIARYSTDFSASSPATGWNYKWNATSALDDPSGHTPLLSDGSFIYDSDGIPGLPDGTSMYYGFAGPGEMHPGKGVSQSETHNRHAIAEYTVPTDGFYSVEDANATHAGCTFSDGVQVTVLVNDAIIQSRLIDPLTSQIFNEDVGFLTAGSTIAVAVGPNGHDGCDAMDIDWSVVFLSGALPVGNPPVVTITSPSASDLWAISDTISFAGSATDPEDGTITGIDLEWEVTIHHNEHRHPDVYSASGESGSFDFPDHDDNSYLEVCLVATDSDGNMGTSCVDAKPEEVVYTFNSVPTGLFVTYNGQSQPAPFSVDVPVGGLRQISAPTPQGSFFFDSWSIGGAATQQVVIANSDMTLDADYLFFDGTVGMDVMPGDAVNEIELNKNLPIPVAILTTSTAAGDGVDFDAQTVNGSTLRFGPYGASPIDPVGTIVDFDSDGDLDSQFSFNTIDTGITCNDIDVTLHGETDTGVALQGTDAIAPCPTCHP